MTASTGLFDPNTYRVPGTRLHAGEYPFAQDPAEARDKLRRYLDAGVSWFVDLTEVGESSLVSYEPVLREEVVARGLAFGTDVGYTRLLVRDLNVPSPARMQEILELVDRQMAAGHTVYVHCWGGAGRTGTVVGCSLVRGGMSGEEALAEVGRLFGTMPKSKLPNHRAGSPQNEAQRSFVRHWEVVEGSTRARVDRICGALWGLAVGDAVGTTVEFKSPGSFDPVVDMVGGGPFGLQPGQVTDDTSMALCLAESLVSCRGFDPRDQMERFIRWWKEGHLSSTGQCFDIGNTVSAAMARFVETRDPIAGSEDRWSAGNGSIMRLAPVAMFYASNPEAGLDACAESSRTTHGARVAVDACRYLGALLLGAFAGASKEELLSPSYSIVPGYWERHPLAPEIAEIALGSFKRRNPPEIRGTGYAADSLEAAVWAFHTTDSFEQGCLRAVNLGDDADTTAAVYGQIAGAFYGEGGIPARWRERLTMRDQIGVFAGQLSEICGASGTEVCLETDGPV